MADQVMPALVTRRAELAGELEKAQGHVQQLHADLASLDAVIRQFDPSYPIASIRAKYTRVPATAEFGAISRTVLDVLRQAGEPLAVAEIAQRIIAQRALNGADRTLRSTMVKRVGMALRYQRTNGMVEEAIVQDGEMVWGVRR